jgi:hypothetical protein
MSARLAVVVAALLLTGAAQSAPGEQASIADQNARAEQQAFDDQLAATARFMRENDMSPKGVSIVLAGMRAEQEQQRTIFRDSAESEQEMRAAADAERFNPATFEAALRRHRESEEVAFSTALNAEIGIFRALSPQDQRIFARLTHAASNARLGIPPRPLRGGH